MPEAGSLRSSCQHVRGEGPLPGHRLLLVPMEVEGARNPSGIPLLQGNKGVQISGLHLVTKALPKSPLPKTVTLGVEILTCEWGGEGEGHSVHSTTDPHSSTLGLKIIHRVKKVRAEVPV